MSSEAEARERHERYRGVWDALEVCRTQHGHLSSHRFGIGCPAMYDALDAIERRVLAQQPCYVWADREGMPTCRGQYAANDPGADRFLRCPSCTARQTQETSG